MKQSERVYWFAAKRYGWGWGLPRTWQGWVVLAIYLACVALAARMVPPGSQPAAFGASVLLLTCVLVVICWITGEPPRWRWGERER